VITILVIGDIVGKPGRKALEEVLSEVKKERSVDCTIANAENAAGGSGVTPQIVTDLLNTGVDVLTSGDHIWRNKAVYQVIGKEERLLRPANYPDETPGHGSQVFTLRNGVKIGVINIVGRIFMKPADCPFHSAAKEVEAMRRETPLVVIDFHAEATSEKIAMGRFLDGRVTAVVGTHTHVQTADECILPGGTAYITDLGMTGPCDSVIGRDVEPVIRHFLTQLPQRFDVAKKGIEFQGVLIGADEKTGKALTIERIKAALHL
jgi:metallophosphoesterase (TIGR00282 family)